MSLKLKISDLNKLTTNNLQIRKDSEDFQQGENAQILLNPSDSQSNNQNYSPIKTPLQPPKKGNRNISQTMIEGIPEFRQQCFICNKEDQYLIQPCQCEYYCHSLCMKAQLLGNNIQQFTNETLRCQECQIHFKIARNDTILLSKLCSEKSTMIGFLIKVIEIIITMAMIGGLVFWMYLQILDFENLDSSVLISAVLIVFLLILLVYFILETIRLLQESTWEIKDNKSTPNTWIFAEELNELEKKTLIKATKAQIIPTEGQ